MNIWPWMAVCVLLFGSGCGRAQNSSTASSAGSKKPVFHPGSQPPPSSVPSDPFPDRDRPNAVILPMKAGLKSPVIVLVYHDIIPVRTSQSLWFDCSVSEFNAQLDHLTKLGCHYITIQQLYDYLTKGQPLPSKPVAITFADGYEGFFKYAIPILKSRGIPVAQFVHTGFVGSPVGRPKMTWAQLEELDRMSWVTIGSQTVTHPLDLRLVHGTALKNEMEDSKKALEDHFHHPVRWLAYPNGKYDEEDEEAAKKAGYLMAMCEHQEPSQKSSSIYAVNRYVNTKEPAALQEAFGD